MKKTALHIILLFLTAMAAHAQEVWTPGTTWDVEYNTTYRPHTLYRLEEAINLDGIDYMPLTATTEYKADTIAYIRSEYGDEMVYARIKYMDELLPECLLYDFRKPYEYGDWIRYGTEFGTMNALISESSAMRMEYVDNVLQPGDHLPMWNGIIYKLGDIEGPIGKYFLIIVNELTYESGPGGSGSSGTSKPKPTNVSHILFGTLKGGTKLIYANGAPTMVLSADMQGLTPSGIYDMQGRRVHGIPHKGLYIENARKKIITNHK